MAYAHAEKSSTSVPHWLVWVGFVALCNATGFLSSLAAGESRIYAELQQPSFAPPSWVFAPVWTSLYVLMGTATFLVWRGCTGSSRRRAMTVFGIQLALNALWTPVFFALGQYTLALALLIAIWGAVLAMTIVYWRRVRLAGVLLLPLLAWVSFAGVLNAAIVRLN
jgi:tryptophan-rich sensory protein